MLQGIQYKPYISFEDMKRDIHTYLEFRFPKSSFKDDLNMWQEFYGKQYESTDEFLKGFLQHDIVEDVYGGWLESKEFDFSRFKRDKEYLFKIGVLSRDPWQKNMNEPKAAVPILACHSARVKNRPFFFERIPAMPRCFASFLPIELIQFALNLQIFLPFFLDLLNGSRNDSAGPLYFRPIFLHSGIDCRYCIPTSGCR